MNARQSLLASVHTAKGNSKLANRVQEGYEGLSMT
jgi:hypothetical protein